jgi:HSP20 family protein
MSFLQNFKKPSSLISRFEEDPFYELQTNINKLFGSLINEPLNDKSLSKKTKWNPSIELKETPKEFILIADLPGCEKKDIHITLQNDFLIIKGERNFEENKNDDKYHLSERFYGSFERQIHMPESLINKEKIDAKFTNGVLTVSLERKNEIQNNSKRIEIN